MQSDVCPLIIVKQSFLYHLEVLVSFQMRYEKNTGFISQDFLGALSSLCNSDLLINFLDTTTNMGLENEPVSKERLRDLFK